MDKEEFLAALRRELLGLTPEDRARWLDYYAELIDDSVEDGRTESEAVEELGTPTALAERILAETPVLAMPEQRSGGRELPAREEKTVRVYDLPGGLHGLSVETKGFDVFLRPGEGSAGRVEITRDDAVRWEVTETDGVLWIRQTGAARPAVETLLRGVGRMPVSDLFRSMLRRVEVILPEREYQELSVRTGSGDVDVDRALGFQVVRVKTAAGDIRYRAAGAILDLETASGDATLADGAFHSLRLRTASGDAALEAVTVQETLGIECTSGDVTLRDVTAAAGEFRTASGDVRGERVLLRDRLTVRTASGDVTLEDLDTGVGEIATASGDVDLVLHSEKDFRVSTGSGDRRVPPALPGAEPFSVRTASGDVTIRVGR